MFHLTRIFKVGAAGMAMLNISCSAPTQEKAKTMTIETERAFEFSPEQVYAAWVAEETIVPPVTRIEKEVKIGSHYRLFVEMENFTGVMNAEYLEIDPNRSLVYTWEWNDDGEETKVTVNFIPTAGGCLVKLTHGIFEKQESFDRHAFGWEKYFDGLEKQLKISKSTGLKSY